YFQKIKTHFGQSMFDQLVTEFAQQSNLYVDEIKVDEWHIYGSSRLGVYEANRTISKRIARDLNNDNQITTNEYVIETPEEVMYLYSNYQLERGAKRYELANHLGNVLTVVSDKKTANFTGTTFINFTAERISATDYSPFGASLAGRTWQGSEYRYGFNGKEKDNEIYGDGNAYNFEARIQDPRLGGRFLSLDPLAAKYPGISPYAYCLNNPLIYVDKDGRDAILIVFPDYKIDPEIKVGKWKAPKIGGLGHAGVLIINNKTGAATYYEYGRYPTKDGTKGRVRKYDVGKITFDKDGNATEESVNKAMGIISQKSGQGGNIEGAYIKSDKYKEMKAYADGKYNESNPGNKDYDKDREPYTLTENNCGTFAADCINQDPTVDQPSISNPTPTNIVDEYQEEGNAPVTYDAKAKKTTIGKGDESDAKKPAPKKK
ncbi:MAG: RHS repeat-associated core domain-containing protein, partial [Bacteroidia bacterium]|nr:RHS repeat-associated core domain-containing protein [Bacteroidia bacterium]